MTMPHQLMLDRAVRSEPAAAVAARRAAHTAAVRRAHCCSIVAAPSDRTEDLFDPGAKYHIPGNTPYIRYFLAHVLQFQFHKSMCEASGHEGPLHTCSVYESKEAGAKLQAMLEMGASKPWPDALEALTGTRQMSADPLVEYFQPLEKYLAEQNKDRTCGW